MTFFFLYSFFRAAERPSHIEMLSGLHSFSSEIPNAGPFGSEVNGPSGPRESVRLHEIISAAERIGPYIRRTPTVLDEVLSERFNTNVYLKLELLQNTGAFKVRGAFNKLLTADDEQLDRGVVAVSAGNHAQAVAFACRELRRKALILMPEDTPENYLSATRRYGADVSLFPTMVDAFRAAKEFEQQGLSYVHPFDDPWVIAGQGTIGLEILKDVPEMTDVIVSIGGGGLVAGVAAAVTSVKPTARIHGVETNGAHSMTAALQAGRVVKLDRIGSIARTLCAPSVGQLPFEIARRHLSGVTVVEDSEAVEELFHLLDRSKVLTEPASACTLAAANRLQERFTPESHVVLILCGGNVGLTDLFNLRPA